MKDNESKLLSFSTVMVFNYKRMYGPKQMNDFPYLQDARDCSDSNFRGHLTRNSLNCERQSWDFKITFSRQDLKSHIVPSCAWIFSKLDCSILLLPSILGITVYWHSSILVYMLLDQLIQDSDTCVDNVLSHPTVLEIVHQSIQWRAAAVCCNYFHTASLF